MASRSGAGMIEELRKTVKGEEFDYQALLSALRDYRYPRNRINKLLRRGDVIRVKKGIYVFGERYARGPVSREILANMIYGPSCVSLDYALHYHGLIPERAEAVTSVTTGRSRRFLTPFGLFAYRRIPVRAYPVGIQRVELEAGRGFLLASPEKALADKLREDHGNAIRTPGIMRSYLFENLRIDPEAFARLDPELMLLLAIRYRSSKLRIVHQVLFKERAGRASP